MSFWTWLRDVHRPLSKTKRTLQTERTSTEIRNERLNDRPAYDQGFVDGLKGRANRYADRQYLDRVAWELASKTKRAYQLRGGYTKEDPGLSRDPRGNTKMIARQLAFPGTPEEYKRGYRAGTGERRHGG